MVLAQPERTALPCRRNSGNDFNAEAQRAAQRPHRTAKQTSANPRTCGQGGQGCSASSAPLRRKILRSEYLNNS